MTTQDILRMEKRVLDWDAHRIREDFPILKQMMNGAPLIYLDNAATSQKPICVIEREAFFYDSENSNVHRSVYSLAETATTAFEEARKSARAFIHAHNKNEIIFTKGATEAINLVARSYGATFLQEGDEIILSELEHHANIVPWQMLAKEKHLVIRIIPMLPTGDLDMDVFPTLFTSRTKLLGITQVSNAIGTINPVKKMIALAHQYGAKVLVDASQSIVHMSLDVQDLDCDFMVFSSHKLYGPMGVGVLYAKEEILKSMPPYQGGGDMIKSVSFQNTEYADVPQRFEAGTPNVGGVIGFGEALRYLKTLPFDSLIAYEQELFEYAAQGLQEIKGVRLVGKPRLQAPIISFVMDGIHPHDVATIISQSGIAVRAGHHCAMPTIKAFGIPATTRISLAFYNTFAELDLLFNALNTVKKVFG